ncbi:CVNH domain-containing protein [Colletotrichum eremochloae]|nr:CVNH domain-containing protein [Colletotrichum eremochloae]
MGRFLPLAPLKGLLLALGAAKVTKAGFLSDGCGFMDDGPEFTLRGDGSITTYCNDKICSTVTFTVINLNDCITNLYGDLQPKADGYEGNFWQTCNGCRIEGTHIVCQCATGDGGFKESSLNVDSIVFNWNGYLSCHSQVSSCYPMPWGCKPANWWPDGWRPTIVDTPCDIWQAAMIPPVNLTLPPGLTLSTDMVSEERA